MPHFCSVKTHQLEPGKTPASCQSILYMVLPLSLAWRKRHSSLFWVCGSLRTGLEIAAMSGAWLPIRPIHISEGNIA
jgi:hypothetical protein